MHTRFNWNGKSESAGKATYTLGDGPFATSYEIMLPSFSKAVQVDQIIQSVFAKGIEQGEMSVKCKLKSFLQEV
jgi:hypothetical protein